MSFLIMAAGTNMPVSGVPLGSVTGSVVFITYVNAELSNFINKICCWQEDGKLKLRQAKHSTRYE